VRVAANMSSWWCWEWRVTYGAKWNCAQLAFNGFSCQISFPAGASFIISPSRRMASLMSLFRTFRRRVPRSAADLNGRLDLVSSRHIAGWVWNKADRHERLRVALKLKGRELGEVLASQFRSDLLSNGIGDGSHSFGTTLAIPLREEELHEVSAEVHEYGYILKISDGAIQFKDAQINVWNLSQLEEQPASRFKYIRFDPNNTCNLRCVYCHNPRTSDVIETERFQRFISTKVISVDEFQVGCVMEPTLDPRLADLLLMVAESPAKPTKKLILQTNGLLLHRHDVAKIKAAGLTDISVSVDAADPRTQRSLRGGASLEKITRNVSRFLSACDASCTFICTVTRSNVKSLADLVHLGIQIGVKEFVFREMFYIQNNDIVDHERMPQLVLQPGEFVDLQERLVAEFGRTVNLRFADNKALDSSTDRMLFDSGFKS
jgi:sulfatase maturation enzyme AslB (radical SAM superfamily)